MIIEEVCKRLELGIRWKFYDIRDTRTLFDLGINPNMPKADKHHALHDAFRQVVGVQNVMRELAKTGVPVKNTVKLYISVNWEATQSVSCLCGSSASQISFIILYTILIYS